MLDLFIGLDNDYFISFHLLLYNLFVARGRKGRVPKAVGRRGTDRRGRGNKFVTGAGGQQDLILPYPNLILILISVHLDNLKLGSKIAHLYGKLA